MTANDLARTCLRFRLVVPSILALAIASDAAAAGPCSEQQKLLASDAADFDNLGISVAISGDTAVVGAWLADNAGGSSAGAAYVYVRNGTIWTEQQKLVASDASTAAWFGFAVAISGDTIVVGANNEDGMWQDVGSAYVYVRSGSVWAEQQKLLAPDPTFQAQFGSSVSVSGDTLVVAAAKDDNADGVEAGGVYVYTRSAGLWTQQQKLVASDAEEVDHFGWSVSLDGDTVVVGAFTDDNAGGMNAGAAYVYLRSGSVWTEQQKLAASDAAPGDSFGQSVWISGDTAVVGANLVDDLIGADAGAAYVYVRSGGAWTEQQKLVASDRAAGASFGVAVGFSGETLIVGAYRDDGAGPVNAGAAYVFVRSGAVWTEQQKLVASDPGRNDDFGNPVAIDGDTAVVGADYDDNAGGDDAGSAYVFVPCCTIPLGDEPSALDRRPGATPLLVTKGVAADTVDVTWEDTAQPKYHVYGGNIADVGPARPLPEQVLCDVPLPAATVDATGVGRWFLVASACGPVASSLGRDSASRERDTPLMPCP